MRLPQWGLALVLLGTGCSEDPKTTCSDALETAGFVGGSTAGNPAAPSCKVAGGHTEMSLKVQVCRGMPQSCSFLKRGDKLEFLVSTRGCMTEGEATSPACGDPETTCVGDVLPAGSYSVPLATFPFTAPTAAPARLVVAADGSCSFQ